MEEVSKGEFDLRNQVVDERCARDKERLDKLEDTTQMVSNLSIQMGEILKRQDAQLGNHESRLGTLEAKPADRWESIIKTVITVVTTAAVTAAISGKLG